jgi:serine/threonine-protein kinase
MGEVWRARDTSLKRDVAIKVLPAACVHDAERLARFQREAEVLASLNHPNIAQIHGLERLRVSSATEEGHSESSTALVMELVEGPTLEDRIRQGAIPLNEALAIARQIADALDAAHERGIIHRDLKPANIKLRDDGTVKVLDFGLAKAMDPTPGSRANFTELPTITSPAMTQHGVILGTAAYMAPEQAKGRVVDKRADIWSFGCVLYEMLAGRRAFDGTDVSDVLAGVIKSEPAWDALPPDLSPVLRGYLRRCLEKDPRQRVRDIGDVSLALKGAFDSSDGLPNRSSPRSRTPRRQAVQVLLASIGVGLVSGVLAWSFWPKPQSGVLSRFRYQLPEGELFWRDGRNVVAVSPDGRAIVYNTPRGLYLRQLGELAARVIDGTERQDLGGPFFSADGRSVGFYSFGAGQLMRIPVGGGAAVPISRADAPFGASWARDDTIVVAQREGIVRVPASGGTPTLVVPAQSGEQLHTPQLLADGRVLFTATRGGLSEIAIQSLTADARHVVLPEGANASYLPTGHLVYTVGSDLFGITFDMDRAAVTGPAFLLERNLLIPVAGWAYGASDNGTLVFRQGGGTLATPVLVDRKGVIVRSLSNGPLERPRHPALDPAGGRLALIAGPPGKSRVWIYHLDGRPAESRTFPGDIETVVWSPSGDRLVVGYRDRGSRGVYSVPLSGDPGPPEPLFVSPDNVYPQAWSKDRREILILRWQRGTDLLAVSVDDPSKTRAVASNPTFNEYYGRLSPNGRWLAYGSLQQGLEIYVRSYLDPTAGGRRVSTVSGNLPLWSRDGKELYYLGRNGQLLALPVDTTGPEFSSGVPVSLFGPPYDFSPVRSSDGTYAHVYYDVDAAGRFIVMRPEGAELLEMIVVLNWQEELKRLVPTR